MTVASAPRDLCGPPDPAAGPRFGLGRAADAGAVPGATGSGPSPDELEGVIAAVQRDLAAGRLVVDGGDHGAAGYLARAVRERHPLLGPLSVDHVVESVLARVRGLGPLHGILADGEVTEIMVNGDGRVFLERRGEVVASDLRLEPETTLAVIERVVAPLGLRVDRSRPLVDARLPDGSRVNAVVPPLAIDGPCLTIRRFGVHRVPLAAFCPPPVAELLAGLVQSRANVVVSGGTGSGKTTLLNALAAAIDPTERLVTIEDAAELRLPGDHVVRLESRPASPDGLDAVTIRDLVRNALRMRPDRILVGECRGGEALDMVQAMNTGHEGSLTTCHANSPADALHRLETMILLADVGLPLAAVRDQLVSSVDVVVQVARRPGGSRAVVSVSELEPERTAEGRLAVHVLADEHRVRAEPVRPARRVVDGVDASRAMASGPPGAMA